MCPPPPERERRRCKPACSRVHGCVRVCVLGMLQEKPQLMEAETGRVNAFLSLSYLQTLTPARLARLRGGRMCGRGLRFKPRDAERGVDGRRWRGGRDNSKLNETHGRGQQQQKKGDKSQTTSKRSDFSSDSEGQMKMI